MNHSKCASEREGRRQNLSTGVRAVHKPPLLPAQTHHQLFRMLTGPSCHSDGGEAGSLLSAPPDRECVRKREREGERERERERGKLDSRDGELRRSDGGTGFLL